MSETQSYEEALALMRICKCANDILEEIESPDYNIQEYLNKTELLKRATTDYYTYLTMSNHVRRMSHGLKTKGDDNNAD